MSEKRREPNFSLEEKTHLFALIVSSYASTLEDKKTDRASVTQKTEAWQEIEREFNSSSPGTTYRKAESLKLLYENKKKALRKKVSEERKERFLTGGGPMPQITSDPIDETLLSILNEKSIYGLPNRFDSDKQKTKIESKVKQRDAGGDYVFELNQGLELEESEFEVINVEKRKVLNEECTIRNAVDVDTESTNYAEKSWKKFKGEDFLLPIAPQLKVAQEEVYGQKPEGHTTKKMNRRRPTHSVKTLTSSDVATKYNLLLDKRLTLVEKQTTYLDDEQEFLKKEWKLKLDLLALKIASEKAKIHKNVL